MAPNIRLQAMVHDALNMSPEQLHQSNMVPEMRMLLRKQQEMNVVFKTAKGNPGNTFQTYRDVQDPQFYESLLHKREFYDHHVPPMHRVTDFESAVKNACSATKTTSFQLSENQSLLRNFISPTTPYNGILLFHDVGVGKTCSAISIAEQFEDRRVTVIAPLNVQSSFRAQIFDSSKVRIDKNITSSSKHLTDIENPIMIQSNQCTGTRYLRGLKLRDSVQKEEVSKKYYTKTKIKTENHSGLTGASQPVNTDVIDAHAQRLISQKYSFIGFQRFHNAIQKMTDADIKHTYTNHVIIVDEAHNLRSQRNSGTKNAYRTLVRVLRACPRGIKLILLTATPMFNDAREIVDLINLLLINDVREPVRRVDLFDEDGNLRNADKLAQACTGYISCVSGRNPLRFPIVLMPDQIKDPSYIKNIGKIYNRDFYGQVIPVDKRISTTILVVSHMHPRQYAAYQARFERAMGNIDDGSADNNSDGSIDDDQDEINLEEDENEDEDEEYEDENEDEDEDEEDGANQAFRLGFEVANLCFPTPQASSIIQFWNCFRRVTDGGMGGGHGRQSRQLRVEYIPGTEAAKDGGFLSPSRIQQYSCKMATIVERIMGSTGVIFVYSRFLWAGLIPLAIALEHRGFMRHGSSNILANQLRKGYGGSSLNPKIPNRAQPQGNYILLTSDSRVCTRSMFTRDLAAATSPSNATGSNVRVIMVCGVGTEGIDFKCVREVHLLDPWYHSNKVAQIVGRACRNCSHAALPVEERNVTVYLHAAVPPYSPKQATSRHNNETVDLHAYRLSEIKQVKIRAVENILRATAIDCALNQTAQLSEALTGVTVTVKASSGHIIKKYPVGKNAILPVDTTKCMFKNKMPTSTNGTDISTFVPKKHVPYAVENALKEIIHTLKNEPGRQALDVNKLYKRVCEKVKDRLIFLTALQEGIDRLDVLYRGGVYMLPPKHAYPNCRSIQVV